MKWVLIVLVLALAGGAAYVRLAPSDPARWHTDPALGADGPNARLARVILPMPPAEALAAFDRVAMATPRTTRLAGSPEEGRITYVTRSRLWGFPDYTTVGAVAAGEETELVVFGRSRFGQSDLGVNGQRIDGWLAALGAPGS
jgi:uncharacterized protein (DUF1499 family)